jgi:putative copper export protein
MLASFSDTVRLSLHVLAATIWVGGQITLAALVPVLRRTPETAQAAARQFNRIAWPAFGVLILTGIWNIAAQPSDTTSSYQAVLGIKMAVVALSGVAAYVHTKVKSRRQIALWGALTGLSAIAAVVLGVLLAG